jgi:hypothetical protein
MHWLFLLFVAAVTPTSSPLIRDHNYPLITSYSQSVLVLICNLRHLTALQNTVAEHIPQYPLDVTATSTHAAAVVLLPIFPQIFHS